MQKSTIGKVALNVGVIALVVYANVAKIQQDRDYHELRLYQLQHPEDSLLVPAKGSDWSEIRMYLLRFHDFVAVQMGEDGFVSWEKSYQDYCKLLPHDAHPMVFGALQFYVDMQVDNDKMLAARIVDKVRKSPEFTEYHQNTLSDLMEEVVDAEEARAS